MLPKAFLRIFERIEIVMPISISVFSLLYEVGTEWNVVKRFDKLRGTIAEVMGNGEYNPVWSN